jgi:hypothetical protein
MAKLNNNGENFIGSFEVTLVPSRTIFGAKERLICLAAPRARPSVRRARPMASKLFTGSGPGGRPTKRQSTAQYLFTVAMKNILGRLAASIPWREVPVRLLFVMPLCALTSSQATAQNNASQLLLALSEDQRNAAFMHLLEESNEKCDRVLRTLFNGTALGLDNWEVLCRDRNSYSLSISPEVSASIEVVSCRELLATSKRLLHRAGRKNKAAGCRIK